MTGPKTVTASSIRQDEQRLSAEWSLPSSTRLLLKPIKSTDVYNETFITARGLEALGGEQNLRRIMDETIYSRNQQVIITDADLRFAESAQYRHVAEGETAEQARARYLDENFGAAMRRMVGAEYNPQTPQEMINYWDDFERANANTGLGGDPEGLRRRIVNIDLVDDLKNSIPHGTIEQRRNWIIAHELKHTETYRPTILNTTGELLSDLAGIRAATPPGAERQQFAREVIAWRFQDEINNTFASNKFGSRTYTPTEWDFHHNTAPYINPDDIERSYVPRSDEVMQDGLDFRNLLSSYGREFAEKILEQHDIPANVSDAIQSAPMRDDLYSNVSYLIKYGDHSKYSAADQAVLARYKADVAALESMPSEERQGKLQEFLGNLNRDCPEVMAQIFNKTYVSNVAFLIMDPSIPRPQVEAYREEWHHIQNTDDNMRASNEFMARFIAAHPDAYERYVLRERPELIVQETLGKDITSWNRAATETVLTMYRNDEILNPNVRRAAEVYLQEMGAIAAPGAEATVTSPVTRLPAPVS